MTPRSNRALRIQQLAHRKAAERKAAAAHALCAKNTRVALVAAVDAGVTKAEIARILNTSWVRVRQLELQGRAEKGGLG